MRAGGGVVTAAVVEEARARAEVAAVAGRPRPPRSAAWPRAEVEATRAAAAEAVRADDRNEVAHQTARAARQRVAERPGGLLAAELEEIRRNRAELEDRIARDAGPGGRAARRSCRPWRRPGSRAAERVAAAREERRRIDERIAEAAPLRSEWEVRSAGLVERRRVLAERLAEVERRLTGHADERRQAAERRTGLEADATAVERLLEVVAAAQARLDAALAELRERHRRQLEAVRAGGARLEELRRQRSASEHELAAARGRLQKIELDLVEATIRRESVVETLRRELGCGPEEALAAPAPELAEGTDPATRIVELEAELAATRPGQSRWPWRSCPSSASGTSSSRPRSRTCATARRELHHVIRTLDEEIMHVFDSAFADVNEHFSTLVTLALPRGHRPAVADRPREPARHRGRGRGPAGRPQRPAPVAAVGRRAVAGGPGLPVRRVPQPAVALLPDGRGRGGARRREPPAVPRPGPRVPRGGPADHREPPEADHGGGRRPLRRDHGPGGLVQGGEPEGRPRPDGGDDARSGDPATDHRRAGRRAPVAGPSRPSRAGRPEPAADDAGSRRRPTGLPGTGTAVDLLRHRDGVPRSRSRRRGAGGRGRRRAEPVGGTDP